MSMQGNTPAEIHQPHSHRMKSNTKSANHENKRQSLEGAKPQNAKSSSPQSTSGGSKPPPYEVIPHDHVSSHPNKTTNINNNKHTGSASSSPSISMNPVGGEKPLSQSNSKTAAPDMVDLNLSNISQGSNVSVVTLGGVEYPVGSRIGKTGMFVIGDPNAFSHPDITSFHSSAPSVLSSTAPIYQRDGVGYSFESWNWSAIRFAILLFICLIMLALLAAVIALAIGQQDTCVAHFEWWKGSTFYSLSVPYFYDSDATKYGDLLGVEKKIEYFEFMGIGAVMMGNIFPSKVNKWDLVLSFTDVDPRIGSLSDFKLLVDNMHARNIKLIMETCPWFTSTDHIWYKESRESSIASLNKYRDFYIWSSEPNSRKHGEWQYDEVRSQYYLHYGDPTKPVLDWNNVKLHNEFNDVLKLWLQRGVDGFSFCDLNKFYAESFDFLNQFHSTLATYSDKYGSKKVLVVDSDFINETAQLNYPLFQSYIGIQDSANRIADMIMTPFYMENKNRITGLVSRIQKALEWQFGKDGPWIIWNLAKLSELNPRYIAALHMLELMLPGTPSYNAGQEIGLFYEENDADQSPMVWMPNSPVPINPGSGLSSEHIWGVRNISTTRKSVFSLRFDRIFGQEDKGLNYKILELDEGRNFILLSRFYPSDKTYYFAGNFGDKVIKKDLQMAITPWATVLSDTKNKYFGRLELREVILDPGEAVVFYPTK